MAKDKYISTRYRRFLDGQANRAEIKALMKKFGTMNEGMLRELVQKELEGPLDNSMLSSEGEETIQRVWNNVLKEVQPISRGYLNYLPYVAAAIALIFMITYYYSELTFKQELQSIEKVSEIEPGYNQATLTLADGRTISLDSSKWGIVIGNGEIVYNDGGLVFFGEDKEFSEGVNTASTNLNTISIPKGGQYHVVLPDGSRVWLNAATTLKYPSRFDGKKRQIEIEGEAYFEISHDKNRPFSVRSTDQEVMVLGTSFNVSAYPDDPMAITTLLTGSVQITSFSNNPVVKRLKPGEQGVLSEGDLSVVKADVQRDIAWKEGLISFTNVPFDVLMRRLERWYDIDVVYETKVPEVFFEGAVERTVTLQKLLEFFRESGVYFSVTNDRKLIIKDK